MSHSEYEYVFDIDAETESVVDQQKARNQVPDVDGATALFTEATSTRTLSSDSVPNLRTILNSNFGPLLDSFKELEHTVQTDWEIVFNHSMTFPRIAIIGIESAGKSSVLERLSNLRFFPKGDGIVTRMPILVSLNRATHEDLKTICKRENIAYVGPDKAIVQIPDVHSRGKFKWFPAIESANVEEIVREAMNSFVRLANNGQLQGVIHDEFQISVYSNSVIDMDLIDLPGVINGVRFGEPRTLAEDTKILSQNFIQDPSTLILAVIPCHEGIATNSIWNIIDQDGEMTRRTIGILTKLDKVHSNSEVLRKVGGEVTSCPLLPVYGYIGVYNGPENTIKTLPEIFELEKEFCIKNGYLSERFGIEALIRRVSNGFLAHIDSSLDRARNELQSLNTISR
jgi:dynamin 1-like protein